MRERAEAVPPEGLSDWWLDAEASDLMHLRKHDREQIAHFGHPAVALAVADWLEVVAGYGEPQPGHGTRNWDAALVVARAYLGEEE